MERIKNFIKTHKAAVGMISFTLLFCALAIVLGVLWLNPQRIENFRFWIEELGSFGVLIMFLIQIARVLFPFLPAEPFELLAGAMYGSLWGTLICMGGILVGSVIVFSLTHRYGYKLLNRFVSKENLEKYGYLKDWPGTDRITFLIYFLPGTPKDVYTYIVGLTSISWTKFLLFTLFARIPSIITSTITADLFLNGKLFWSISIYAAAAVLALLGLAFHKKVVQKKIR